MKFFKSVADNILVKDNFILFSNDSVLYRQLNWIFKKEKSFIIKIKNNPAELKKIAVTISSSYPRMIIFDLEKKSTNSNIVQAIKKIRKIVSVPIIVLGENKIKEIIKWLGYGIDDYVTKPLNAEFFMAKIRAILRRINFTKEPEEIITCKNIEINKTNHIVKVSGKQKDLTPKEFALLYFLAKNKNKILTRKFLLENIWERSWTGDPRTLNKHIETLRKKLGKTASLHIETIKGMGYKFKP